MNYQTQVIRRKRQISGKKLQNIVLLFFSKIQSLKKKISKSFQQGNFLIFVIFLFNYNDKMGIIG